MNKQIIQEELRKHICFESLSNLYSIISQTLHENEIV